MLTATQLMRVAKGYTINSSLGLILGGCLLPAGLLVFAFLPENFWSALPFELCLVKLLTGHECWGCGILRGFSHLVHGNFAATWESNFLVYFWLSAGIVWTAWCWAKLVRKCHD